MWDLIISDDLEFRETLLNSSFFPLVISHRVALGLLTYVKCLLNHNLLTYSSFIIITVCAKIVIKQLHAYIEPLYCTNKNRLEHHRADSRLAPSQWETSLQSKAVFHWLGANLESALHNHSTENESCHDATFFTAGTRACRSYGCRQWRQSWHNDDFK